ncbi:MAG: YnbE family lipoprotein [Geminicoccaceae bacterium]|nr:YnbE family lipoprotein [Geminicoccaceae bacterium]
MEDTRLISTSISKEPWPASFARSSTAIASPTFWPGTRWTSFAGLMLLAALASACQPTVKVEAPEKPITINLNVKIEQEVRIRVDRDVDRVMQGNPDIF